MTQKMMLKHAMGEVAGYGQDEEGAVLPRCAGVKDRHGQLAGGGRSQMSQPGPGAHLGEGDISSNQTWLKETAVFSPKELFKSVFLQLQLPLGGQPDWLLTRLSSSTPQDW